MRPRKKKADRYQFRSKFEQKIADQLDKSKAEYEYETVKIKYTVPESKHVYTPDFILPNGIFLEVKGLLDSSARKKMALIKAQHGDLYDIRFVFMRDQPIRKHSPTRYSDWCNKLNYKYCFGTVPTEWLE